MDKTLLYGDLNFGHSCLPVGRGAYLLFGACLPAGPGPDRGRDRQGIWCLSLLEDRSRSKPPREAGAYNAMRGSGIVTNLKKTWNRSLLGGS